MKPSYPNLIRDMAVASTQNVGLLKERKKTLLQAVQHLK